MHHKLLSPIQLYIWFRKVGHFDRRKQSYSWKNTPNIKLFIQAGIFDEKIIGQSIGWAVTAE